MPHHCSSNGCYNVRNLKTKEQGITFHKFPHGELRKAWESGIGRKGFIASKHSVLCSQHFNPQDFDRTGQTVRLREGVIPSLFNFPSNLQKQNLPPRLSKTSQKAIAPHQIVIKAQDDADPQALSWKMPRHCSAGGCNSRDTRENRKAGITFHKLPKGNIRRKLWISNSHRSTQWDPQTDFVYFCSKHFTTDSFELTGYSGIRRLKEDAFPTVFEAPPAAKRKGGRPRKRPVSQSEKKTNTPKAETTDQAADPEAADAAAESKDREDVDQSVAANGAESPAEGNNAHCVPQSTPETEVCPLPSPEAQPPSPSRFMRRLPPLPGFYLPREHCYAQSCPQLWVRRYDQVVDYLEKALRELRAARRRESRLRVSLTRLREKHLKQTPLFWRDGARRRGGPATRGWTAGTLDSELYGDGEEPGLLGSRAALQADLDHYAADANCSEEEGGYCFHCGDGGAAEERGDGKRLASKSGTDRRAAERGDRPRGKHAGKRSGAAKAALATKRRLCARTQSAQAVQVVVLEQPLRGGGATSVNHRTGLAPPAAQQRRDPQGLSNGLSLVEARRQYVQPHSQELQVYMVQERADGELCLVPVSGAEELQCVEEVAEDGETILVSEVGFQKDLGQTTGGNGGQLLDNLSRQFRVEMGSGDNHDGQHGEDVREILKEHLEGFHLQLSSEFIT